MLVIECWERGKQVESEIDLDESWTRSRRLMGLYRSNCICLFFVFLFFVFVTFLSFFFTFFLLFLLLPK